MAIWHDGFYDSQSQAPLEMYPPFYWKQNKTVISVSSNIYREKTIKLQNYVITLLLNKEPIGFKDIIDGMLGSVVAYGLHNPGGKWARIAVSLC